MPSLKPKLLNAIRFSPEQAATLQKIAVYFGKQALYEYQSPEALETLRQLAVVESSESSNRLEGITAPHDRVEALVLKAATPKNRSEQEIAGYRDALALIHESAQYMKFSLNVILQLHALVYRYLPGEGGRWKMTDNEIIERNPDGSFRRVRFKPVRAIQTPFAIEALIDQYNEIIHAQQSDPLLIIPLVILDFLCIHPFTDGNGRVSRLLTLLLLYHFGYQVGRYISLERIFEESKETYYEALEKSSRGWHEDKHDPYPWMTYCWGVVLRAYKEFEERVGTIRTGRGAKTEQIRLAVERKVGPFSISDIEAECPGISRDMIRIVLRKLRDEQIILPQGKGRGAKWIRKR